MTGTKSEVRKGAALLLIGAVLWALSQGAPGEVAKMLHGAGALLALGGAVVVAIGLLRD